MQNIDVDNGAEGELLVLLADLARSHEVCPSNERLGRRIGLSPFYAQAALAQLREAGRIEWTIHRLGDGLGKVRVVTIRATGEQTRLPLVGGRRTRRHDKELEAAKTILRRKGYIVFDAWVTDGKQGRGLIRVDHRRLPREAVLALAASVTF